MLGGYGSTNGQLAFTASLKVNMQTIRSYMHVNTRPHLIVNLLTVL